MSKQAQINTLLREVQGMLSAAGDYLNAGELDKLNITMGEAHRRVIKAQGLTQQVLKEAPDMIVSAASLTEKLGRFSATA